MAHCSCEIGCYGTGPTCESCTRCLCGNANAFISANFAAGSLTNSPNCSCNAGYWGDGKACSLCKRCDPMATTLNSCEAASGEGHDA